MKQPARSRMMPFALARPFFCHRPGSLAETVGQQSVRRSGWQWLQQTASKAAAARSVGTSDRSGGVAVRDKKMARLETVLLVSDGALSFRKLAQLASVSDAKEVRGLIERLNRAYDASGCAFRVEEVAGGYRLLTRPQFAMWLDRLHNRQARARLSSSMLETLAIVAYRQPVTRAEIEKIRGVQASEMLKQLMERSLVRITGEDDSLGRPFLYGTTRQFLEEYGFGRLDDLPMADTLRRRDEVPEQVSEVDDAADSSDITDDSGSPADEQVTLETTSSTTDPESDTEEDDAPDDEERDGLGDDEEDDLGDDEDEDLGNDEDEDLGDDEDDDLGNAA